MDWSVEHLDGAGTLAMADEIQLIYRACFTAPPWNETEQEIAEFGERLPHCARRPGFETLLARDSAGDLIGVCFGWPTPDHLDDARIYHRMREAIGPEETKQLTRGAFEVAELMVASQARGRGIGRQLLASIIAGWPRAWLCTRADSPAARLYERLGWHPALLLPPYDEKAMTVFTWTAREILH